VLWTALALILCSRYSQKYGHWTTRRLGMTNDLVEQLTGHRTRVAQQPRAEWHQAEDRVLDGYIAASSDTDRSGALLLALIPRGWLVIGVATLAPHFLSATGASTGLAIALGGVLLAFRALRSLSRGLWQLVGARVAWNQVGPIFLAATRSAERTHPAAATTSHASAGASGERGALVEANNIFFQFPGRVEPVLRGCNLRIANGDRVLIEGASGGGKSTLASLLAGLRSPGSGLLLVSGLDRETLGPDGWRRQITCAPQFHENHVLTGTFAFNLLMGRRWPPWSTDMAEAESLCRELGLGELLDRMPAGLQQTVGETGWQLSHGERSRLFIARTLLQGADLIILDESFAALDPENLRRAMNCVLKRAPSLLVVAHP
jgi:ATP-binding cassette subfamily B protein